jgi:chemotaxis protein MotB
MSKKKRHKPHEEEGGEAWLLPYSDLMTLLLAVFIVLFAVSQVDVEKAQAMSDQFSESMMTEGYNLSHMQEQMEAPAKPVSEADQMEALKAELDAKLKKENLTASVKTSIDKRVSSSV